MFFGGRAGDAPPLSHNTERGRQVPEPAPRQRTKPPPCLTRGARRREKCADASPARVRGAEHAIPELGGHAEVARLARVMMQRVAALQAIEIRTRANAAMMEHVVHAAVPDIAQHQARGDPAGEIKPSSPPQWKQRADADRR